MRDRDVPQDDGALYAGQLRRVTWAVGEDGEYTPVASAGWEAEIDATAASVEDTNRRIQAAWDAVQAGEKSPLAYHLAVNLLDAATAALELGTFAFRVRRHLKPHVFAKLSASWRESYAALLGLSVDVLATVPSEPELYAVSESAQ